MSDFEGTAPVESDNLDSVSSDGDTKLMDETEATNQAPEVSNPEPSSPEKPNSDAKPPKAAEPLFDDLALSRDVLLAVHQAGYVSPTKIQAEIIPHLLEDRDVLAQSETGSGKTAAFALPILSRMSTSHATKKRHPVVLVLAPTRELAEQVSRSFATYGDCIPKLRIAAIYGGADYEPQLRLLRKGAHIVVGTPGRVIDHIKRGSLDLTQVEHLVLDEADEMLKMGFQDDVEFILDKTPKEKQTALFSATLPKPIRHIAQQHLQNPAEVTIRKQALTAETIEQKCLFVAEHDKLELLSRLLEIEDTDGVIVFTKTKEATLQVAEHLSRNGHNAAALNGDLPQARRQRTVDQLKKGQIDVLVATDVAARGLDVQRISHVFNYDMPHDGESYVHRIGRTGRAGRTGVAMIFLNPRQRGKLKLIERVTRQTIEVIDAPKARDLNIARVAKFKAQIKEAMSHEEVGVFKNILSELASESGLEMEDIAAAVAHLAQRGRPFLTKDRPKPKHSSASSEQLGRKGRSGSFGRNQRPPESGMRRYHISVGHDDGVKPGNIVGAVANEGGLSGRDVGPIRIRDSYSTVDLPDNLSPQVLATLKTVWVAGKQMQLREYTDRPPSRGGRSGKPPWAQGHHPAESEFSGKKRWKRKPPHKKGGKKHRSS